VFRTFTRDLKRLRSWLLNMRVSEIVMESTGQYWRPVWNILDGVCERMLLVNPLHVKGLKGRKTDRIDARWLATRLEREDDLRGSFIPPREIRELRELTRTRVHLLEDLNRVQNRIGQLCETGNIKIASVCRDLFGASGRSMLNALVEGKRDAGWMADYARGSLRRKKKDLELALQGTLTEHQRDLMKLLLEQMCFLEDRITKLMLEIERRVQPYEDRIRRLDTIPGINRVAAWTILAETGTDMNVFEDARQLASWAAVCPGNQESGGKRLSGKTRKGNAYLRRILCQCAWAAARTNGSYLASLFHRIRARRGEQKANMALAHHLLTIVFHVLRDGTEYIELGADHHDRKNKPKMARKLLQRLERLGYQVTAVELPVTEQPTSDDPLDQAPVTPSNAPRRRRGRPCKCAERGVDCTHIPVTCHPNNPPEIPFSASGTVT
jgi:transposase